MTIKTSLKKEYLVIRINPMSDVLLGGPMSVNKPHAREPGRRGNPVICNATNRKKRRCNALAVTGSTKCRHHGGKSLKGFMHPNYKHGFYSVQVLDRAMWAPRLRHMRREIVEHDLGIARAKTGHALSMEQIRAIHEAAPRSKEGILRRFNVMAEATEKANLADL